MAPIERNGQEIDSIKLNNSEIDTVEVNGQVVFNSQLVVAQSNLTNWYPFDPDRFGGVRTDDVSSIIGGTADSTNYSLSVDGPVFETNVGATEYGKNAYDFNQTTTDRLIIDGAFGFGDTSERTVSAWATFNDSTDSYGCLYGDYTAGGDNIFRYGNNNATTEVYSIGIDGESVSGFPRQSYGFKLWTLTYDGNNFRAYFDGVKQDTLADDPPVSGGDNFKIGNRGGLEDESWGGYITDFRIYNRALTDTEVNQIYLNTEP